jgi:hypothetical protein
MKIYTVILLLINLVSFGQDSTLFVGNSMIKYDKNHTLEILENILKNQSKKHYFTDKTSNGTSLYKHLTILPAHKKTFFGASFAFGTDQIEKAEVPAYILKTDLIMLYFKKHQCLLWILQFSEKKQYQHLLNLIAFQYRMELKFIG